MTRFLLAQNNPIIGDFKINTQKILASIESAKQQNCPFIISSELALTGYPPKDLLYYPSFFTEHEKALQSILPHTKGITLILGGLRQNKGKGFPLHNSLFVIEDGKIIHTYDKWLLPTYDVFDEKRYFQQGSSSPLFEIRGKKIALTLCEDIWADEMKDLYPIDPLEHLTSQKPDIIINLSASPFEVNKLDRRLKLAQNVSKKYKCPLLFCNQVGGHDSLIFDGYSFAVSEKGIVSLAKGFEEDELVVDTDNLSLQTSIKKDETENLYQALVLGIRDYFSKQNFQKAILGLSGGIDSALVATIAAKALGKENVLALAMPSRFSSDHSIQDAEKLSKNLGIEFKVMPIESVHQSYLDLFKEPFKGLKEDATEENIQSRIRGMILMAYSNKFHRLVLSCGNKSEMAMGYATLYGDLAGGLSVISDLTKSQVYELARWINTQENTIPKSILAKPPSAELKPDQKDSDTLPDYEIIDAVIQGYIEEHLDPEKIAQKYKIDLDLVVELIRKIHQNEYKRRQTPTGLKVTQKAFSMGWHFPIVHHFSG